ncbi:MAG: TonB-dependent receptor, partial [Sphingobacteriales bacterium]
MTTPRYQAGVGLLMLCFVVSAQSQTVPVDQQGILDSVRVNAARRLRQFNAVMPVQTLDKVQLNQINAISVADAAKYFPGVLIRDYGGAGGLKTISVRSLGAAHTGILY